jgi:hypothetical protein
MERHAGRKLTPGYIVYALDTYRKIWCAAIEEATPRGLRWASRPLERALDLACLVAIGHQVKYAQGLSRDWWAGKRAKLMVPGRGDKIEISGYNPSRDRDRLRLDVSVDGVMRGTHVIGPGTFRLEYSVTGERRLHSIETLAYGYHHRAKKPDRLRRYFRLDTIAVLGAGAEPELNPPGREFGESPGDATAAACASDALRLQHKHNLIAE